MASVTTSIKIEEQLKKESQVLFEKLGMNLSTAINVFLRQSVKEQAIPFRIGEAKLNTETIKAIEDAKKGIGISRPFSSVDELMEDLNADD